MSETKQTSNVKPEEWYTDFYDPTIKDGMKGYFIELKDEDKRIDVYYIIDNYLAPLREQIREAMAIMDPIYKKYEKLPLKERNDKLMSINEFVAAKNQFDKAYKSEYGDIPPGVTEEAFGVYHQIIRGKIQKNLRIIFDYNTLEKNAKLLEVLVAKQNLLKKNRSYKQIFSLTSCKGVYKIRDKKFKLCEQAIKKGYLITNQLEDLDRDIKECRDCFLREKERKRPKNILDLNFEDFSYTDEQVFNLIRKNAKWYDIERDIAIFQERQKGKYLKEIAKNLRIKLRAVSMVVKKVQGAVNYWQGKLFEDFVLKRLRESTLFEKVVLEAGKGESDIKAYTKDDKLYIYSLKNIQIDYEPYWLTKEELRPELRDALLSKLDYEVYLILLIFDNYNNQVKQFVIDYNNPKNIDISK
jgi:hypothetical protein